MLPVLLIFAAAIAYLFIQRRASAKPKPEVESLRVREETNYDDVNTAQSARSFEFFDQKPSSDVATACSPTQLDYWRCRGSPSDVSLAQSADCFDQLRWNFASTVGPSRDVFTARSPRHFDATRAFSAEYLHPQLRKIGDVATAKSFSAFDVREFARLTEDFDVETAIEELDIAKYAEENTCLDETMPKTAIESVSLENCGAEKEDTNKSNFKDAVFLAPLTNDGPVPPDPATESAQKSMKKRRRRKNNKNKQTLSVGSETSVKASEENITEEWPVASAKV